MLRWRFRSPSGTIPGGADRAWVATLCWLDLGMALLAVEGMNDGCIACGGIESYEGRLLGEVEFAGALP